MLITVGTAADRTHIHTDRTNFLGTIGASDAVLGADQVVASLKAAGMFGTDLPSADPADHTARAAPRLAAEGAGNRLRSLGMTGGTLDQTVMAVALAVGTGFIETRSHFASTACTGHQAVGAETLAAGAAYAQIDAVLTAARTAHRAIGADQWVAAVGRGHAVGAQMAAALQLIAVGTGGLTG